jgi:hypothetical protein
MPARIRYSKHYTLPVYFLRCCKILRGDRPTVSQWCKDNNRPHHIRTVISSDSLTFGNWTTPFFAAAVFCGVRWISENGRGVLRHKKGIEHARLWDTAAAVSARREWKQWQRILGNKYIKEQIRTGCLLITKRSAYIWILDTYYNEHPHCRDRGHPTSVREW